MACHGWEEAWIHVAPQWPPRLYLWAFACTVFSAWSITWAPLPCIQLIFIKHLIYVRSCVSSIIKLNKTDKNKNTKNTTCFHQVCSCFRWHFHSRKTSLASHECFPLMLLLCNPRPALPTRQQPSLLAQYSMDGSVGQALLTQDGPSSSNTAPAGGPDRPLPAQEINSFHRIIRKIEWDNWFPTVQHSTRGKEDE